MKLPSHGRYDWSPLPRRPDYSWPDGKRLALYFDLNTEHFAFKAGLGSDSTGHNNPQTHRNYSWRDYGNRVGIWWIFDLFDELDCPLAHNMNSMVLEQHPEIGERIVARGDEFVSHGRSNAERQDVLWEEDEKRLIDETTEVIARHWGGKRPVGWMSPYLAHSNVTLDLLVEAGYRYQCDWPADDQPFFMRTRSGPILSMPYSVEMNDSPAIVMRHNYMHDYADMMIDQFDEMLLRSKKHPMVCSFPLHTFVVGHPFRLRHLRRAVQHMLKHRDEIWLTTPGAISDHCWSLPKGTIPGS